MTVAALTSLSASELVRFYRTRALSPVAVTRAVLDRIESKNGSINAFVVVDSKGALAAAAESEARWGRGEPLGLLDGVPVSVKDLLAQRGLPTRRGSKTSSAAASDDDAPAVARLREHGAVLLGKTTTRCQGLRVTPLGRSGAALTRRHEGVFARAKAGTGRFFAARMGALGSLTPAVGCSARARVVDRAHASTTR